MTLSVVLGTYNRLELLRECISSIVEQTSTRTKIYVTDAGSTDGTIEYLKAIASKQIIPIFVGEKVGQARAYNDVFENIETPYTSWLSDDNVVVNKGLDIAVQILEENSEIGMVALKTKDKQGPFVEAPYIGGVSEIGVLNVNQGLLRTSILKQVGGFSEAFRDYGIDPDLTAKVLFSGYDIVYTREIALNHYRNWGTDRSSPEYRELMQKQKRYLELYRQKYAPYSRSSPFWELKKNVWLLARRGLGVQRYLNSHRPVLGVMVRDLHNILTSRYISLLDPLLSRGKAYHLVQHCPHPLNWESLLTEPISDLSKDI